MIWRISMLLGILLFVSCDEEIIEDATTGKSQYIIDEIELESMLTQEHVKILDFRKKENYNDGHIPGATHIWRTDIEDISYNYSGMMPSQDQVETLFGNLGIENEDLIIIYDDNGMCDASRLWWILQNYNYKKVKMLEGGLSAWKAGHGEMTKDIPVITKKRFKLSGKINHQYYISKEEMMSKITSDNLIIDTRTTDEFIGKRQKKGAAKSGRIPTSKHLDWVEAINYHGDKKLKTTEELERIYSQLSKNKEEPIILYCHSGVRSAHTTFVMTQILGYKNVKNYDGSWVEWSHMDNLPYELDTKTIKNKKKWENI